MVLVESRVVFRRVGSTGRRRTCCSALRRRVAERLPYTAGYWWLLSRNEERLRGNVRMAQPVRGLRRLQDLDAVVEQEQHRASSPP